MEYVSFTVIEQFFTERWILFRGRGVREDCWWLTGHVSVPSKQLHCTETAHFVENSAVHKGLAIVPVLDPWPPLSNSFVPPWVVLYVGVWLLRRTWLPPPIRQVLFFRPVLSSAAGLPTLCCSRGEGSSSAHASPRGQVRSQGGTHAVCRGVQCNTATTPIAWNRALSVRGLLVIFVLLCWTNFERKLHLFGWLRPTKKGPGKLAGNQEI